MSPLIGRLVDVIPKKLIMITLHSLRITLLVNLNSRNYEGNDETSGLSYPSGGRTNLSDHYGMTSGHKSRAGGVNVETTTNIYVEQERPNQFERAQVRTTFRVKLEEGWRLIPFV